MPRDPVSAVRSRAREQFNDLVSDTFASLQKDQRVFYVGSVDGNTSFSGRRITAQKATVAQATALCTASRGDTVLVSPFHTETVTSTISLSVAGTILKGLKLGNQRPKLTINGATDLISLDAAGCQLSGFEFAIVTTDAATAFVNVTAARCKISDLYAVDCSAAANVNVVDTITLASGANYCQIEGIKFFNTTTAVNSFVSIEAAVDHLELVGNVFVGSLATAGIIDGATATQIVIKDNIIQTVGTNIPACILDSNPTGVAIHNYMLGTDATIANNAQWGSALILADNYTRGGTGSTVSASNIIPALDT